MRDSHFVHGDCCYTRENGRCEHWICHEKLWREAHARDGLTNLARRLATEFRSAGLRVTADSLRTALLSQCSPIQYSPTPLYIDGDQLERIARLVANEVSKAVGGM